MVVTKDQETESNDTPADHQRWLVKFKTDFLDWTLSH